MKSNTVRFGEAARGRLADVVSIAARFEDALRKIAELPKQHTGDKDERDQNDMEDAFSNGIDVGNFEGVTRAADIAKVALRVPARARR